MEIPLIKAGDVIFHRDYRSAYCVILAVFEKHGSFTMMRIDDAEYGGNLAMRMTLCTPVNQLLLTRKGWETAGWKFAEH